MDCVQNKLCTTRVRSASQEAGWSLKKCCNHQNLLKKQKQANKQTTKPPIPNNKRIQKWSRCEHYWINLAFCATFLSLHCFSDQHANMSPNPPKLAKHVRAVLLGWLRMGGVSIRAGTHGPHQLFCDLRMGGVSIRAGTHGPHQLFCDLRMGGVSIRAGTHGPHQLFCDENSSLQPACKVWPYCPHRLCHDSDQSSPWYNRNGWLGIKHQVTYLFDEISHWIVLHFLVIPLVCFILLCTG